MVSHSVRPTRDDKCSDLKQSVRCFEELIFIAKEHASNEEIESYIRQAFEGESSSKRLRELNDAHSNVPRFNFCMTSFCAYFCEAFEKLANIKVDIDLTICVHNLPACGSKRASENDFVSRIRKETTPTTRGQSKASQILDERSMANGLLRFYRKVSGLTSQGNPVRSLLVKERLLGSATTTIPATVDGNDSSTENEGLVERTKKETTLPGKNVKHPKGDTAEPFEGEDEGNDAVFNLRKELNRVLDPNTGWIARAQTLQDQLEAKDAALRKQAEGLEVAKVECKEQSGLKVSNEVLKDQVELLEGYLRCKTEKAVQLEARLAEVEDQRDKLENKVAYQMQITAEQVEKRDEDFKKHKSLMEKAELNTRKLRVFMKKARRVKKGGGGQGGRGWAKKRESYVEKLKKRQSQMRELAE